MSAKISKKFGINAQGILFITEDGQLAIENADTGESISLAELFIDFADKDVKLSIAYAEDF
jgi:hypothetical protein